jgi:hypothetical protein
LETRRQDVEKRRRYDDERGERSDGKRRKILGGTR